MPNAFSGLSAMTGSQAITAGGSLVLQVIAARELGLAGFGAFALCLSMLSTVTALYAGYVGDSLTVLDRHEQLTRGGLVVTAMIGLAASFAVAVGLALVLHLGSVGFAFGFGGLVAAWLTEEVGRRVLMARLQFWGLVLNDATYMSSTLLILLGAVLAGVHISLAVMIAAMAAGALVATALARVQLPALEYAGLRPRRAGVAQLNRFALWRSLQAALRPSELLVAKILVQQLAGLAAVGAVEAGRLVVAPLQTVLGGVSAFLLSSGAAGAGRPRPDHRRNERVAVALVAATLVGGAIAAALSHPLGRLLARHPIGHLLVLGWAIYLTMWAASLPYTAELTVRRLSWPVFVARLIETAIALALVVIALAGGASAATVPWLLAAPALVNTWYLRRLAVRTRPSAAPARSAPETSIALADAPTLVFARPSRGRASRPSLELDDISLTDSLFALGRP